MREETELRPGMAQADFITSIFLLFFGVGVTVLSIRMPRLEHRGINPYTVPGIVPGVIGAAITVMSATLLIRSVLQKGYSIKLGPGGPGALFRNAMVQRVSVTVGICLVYALALVGTIPYPVATFLFVFVFMLLFEYQRQVPLRDQRKTVVVAALEAVLTAVLVSVLFRYLFLVRLP